MDFHHRVKQRSNDGEFQTLMRKLLLLFVLILAPASAADTYYAQTSQGANNGTSCANALAIPSSISGVAGTTYHLCGTFTASPGANYLTLSGGGSSGNPAILFFETGAIMQATYWGTTGAISITGSNWTVDGGTNGIIRATLNGTAGGAGCTGGACQHLSTSSRYMTITSTTNVEIKNLSLLNLYVFSSVSDSASGLYGIYAISNTGLTIDHNTMSWAWYMVFLIAGGTTGNISIHDNTFANNNVGIAGGDGGAGAVIAGPVTIYNNEIYGMSSWDDTADNNHHDGIYIWITLASSSFTGAYNLYNNHIYGLGANCTALMYFDPGATSTYPNATAFNNVLDLGSDVCGDNAIYDKSGKMRMYNNTILRGPLTSIAGSGGSTTLQNNISGAVQGLQFSTSPCSATTCDYNDWYSLTNNPQMVYGNTPNTYAAYRTATGLDSHSITSNPNLDGNYKPQAGSPVIGAGLNLFSICNGQPNPGLGALCLDKAGVARPSVGGWDIGAFQFAAGGSPGASLSPSTLTFSTNQLTTSATQFTTLTNTGTANLVVSGVTVSGSFSNTGTGTCTGTSFTLSAGSTCTFGISFSPGTTGPFTGTLSVSDNASGSPHTAALSGTGTAPIAAWSPTTYAFGSIPVGNSVNSSAITLTNSGTGPLSVNLTFTGIGAPAYSVASTTCASTLAAISSCTVTVRFTPSSAIGFTSNLVETDSVQSISTSVLLSGTGTASVVAPNVPILLSGVLKGSGTLKTN